MLKKMLLTTALAALSLAGAPRAALPNTVTFRNFFESMTFNRPVHFVPYPGQDSAYVVVQQSGRLVTVRRINDSWMKTDSASITVNGGTSGGNEQGLLGFAFHPSFNANRKYYVYYITGTGAGSGILAERTADETGRPKTSDAQRTVLRFVDPYENHNGGTIEFGTDGYLYFSLGDGGSGGDPQGRAQNLDVLFGKILRIDPLGADAFPSDTTRNYAIPADNPFVGQSNRQGEIWAYGLRNPWKWSFHPTTGALWVGDVGQDAVEEISRVPKGGNMGWKIREGNACYSPSTGCTSVDLVPATIALNQPLAQSITGGAFFTGNPASAYHGVYIFGDYVTDSVWAARIVNDSLAERIHIGRVYNVSSFNRDAHGRVFALALSSTSSIAANNGIVYVLESPDMAPAPVSLRHAARPFAKPITVAEFRRDPSRFTVQGLDGRALHGKPSGMVMIREKGAAAPAQLITLW